MLETTDEIENFIKEKIKVELEKFKFHNSVTWDLARGDCPLGWDVSVYFHNRFVLVNHLKFVVNLFNKAIKGLDFTDWDSMELETDGNWLKVVFQVDFIN